MPTYDYVCRSCGHIVEVVHGIHDTGPTICPECGGQLRKALSTPTIHFKGSGWAKKDRSSKPVTAKSDAESGKSTADSTKTADAKAAADTAKPSAGAASEAS